MHPTKMSFSLPLYEEKDNISVGELTGGEVTGYGVANGGTVTGCNTSDSPKYV